jgi:hypothetical protein
MNSKTDSAASGAQSGVGSALHTPQLRTRRLRGGFGFIAAALAAIAGACGASANGQASAPDKRPTASQPTAALTGKSAPTGGQPATSPGKGAPSAARPDATHSASSAPRPAASQPTPPVKSAPPGAKPIPPAPGATAPLPAASPVPTLSVHLSRPMYRIRVDPKSGAPIMPRDIEATAHLDDWPASTPKPATLTWHVYLDWDFKPCPTRHSIDALKFERPSPFRVDLGSEIRGGRLKVIAKTTLDGREIGGFATADVLGENPSRAQVLRAFPPNRIGLIASKIAMAESGMRQFDPISGMPTVSRTNDVGMMQLNAPTSAVTSADQVWDWRANLKRGLEMMDDKRRTTVLASRGSVNRQPDLRDIVMGYEQAASLSFLRWYIGLPALPPPAVPPLSPLPGSGMLPGEPDPDHLALSQVERDAIRRYNGGREYALALETEPETLSITRAEWQVDPTRGGVRARAGDPDYILHVLSARSGFVIPKPAALGRSTHRRFRHRRRRANE